MQFKGNPLCTPVGKLRVSMSRPPINMMQGQMHMYQAQHHGVDAYLSMHNPGMWMTKEGQFSFNCVDGNALTATLPQLLEKLKENLGGGDDVEIINAHLHNPGTLMHLAGIPRYDVRFETILGQAVKIAAFDEHDWGVLDLATRNWYGVNLKRHVPGVFTIEEGAKDITLHMANVNDIVCRFNKAGHLVNVFYKDTEEPVESLHLNVNNPFLDLIESDGVAITTTTEQE
jgi:hypothetical protein